VYTNNDFDGPGVATAMPLRRKMLLAGVYWVLQAAVVHFGLAAWVCLDADKTAIWRWDGPSYARALADADYAIWSLGAAAAIALLQTVFLWPVRKPTAKPASGWSVFLSLAVAGLAVAGLCGAAAASAIQFLLNYGDVPVLEDVGAVVVLGTLAVSWVMGTYLLVAFCQPGRRECLLRRLSARLLTGTIVEVAAIIPLDVLVRKRESCYCGAGTFLGLIACGAVGLFALGPAIILPLMIRRRKRWYAGLCESCGYDMSGMPTADRCPECGLGWKSTARTP
jgi:hypothetical protein